MTTARDRDIGTIPERLKGSANPFDAVVAVAGATGPAEKSAIDRGTAQLRTGGLGSSGSGAALAQRQTTILPEVSDGIQTAVLATQLQSEQLLRSCTGTFVLRRQLHQQHLLRSRR